MRHISSESWRLHRQKAVLPIELIRLEPSVRIELTSPTYKGGDPAELLTSDKVVSNYKRLSDVERGFGSLKSVDLKIRPIHHHLEDRVRAHVFLCMLSYYVEWHMRQALAPILFDDDDPQAAEAARQSVVSPAQRSPQAKSKDALKRTEDGMPVHSFQTLLQDLATLTCNEVSIGDQTLHTLATPTPIQLRALQLLHVSAAL